MEYPPTKNCIIKIRNIFRNYNARSAIQLNLDGQRAKVFFHFRNFSHPADSKQKYRYFSLARFKKNFNERQKSNVTKWMRRKIINSTSDDPGPSANPVFLRLGSRQSIWSCIFSKKVSSRYVSLLDGYSKEKGMFSRLKIWKAKGTCFSSPFEN